MKTSISLVVLAALCVCVLAPRLAWAEMATEDEMRRVCENWLAYIVHQRGSWAGSSEPSIVDVQEIVIDGIVMGRCYSIAPNGYVVVPSLKGLHPVKMYSERYALDVSKKGGAHKLIRDVLEEKARLWEEKYGSLDAAGPAVWDVSFGPDPEKQWTRYGVTPAKFASELTSGEFGPMSEVGPLLTSAWHQGAPYNNSCPDGDLSCTDCCPSEPYTCNPSFPSLVGCVATAAAQIMNYHRCPNNGTGSHDYTWNGDQTCGGSAGGGTVSAIFSDAYDWAYMPDDCGGGCTQDQQDALAELCFEVGVAFEMDYGVCGSGAYTSDAVTVFPTYFGYDSSIEKLDRPDYTPSEWFVIIQNQINLDQPIQYRIKGHSIVCDGWRDTGGILQYHMNYGWADGHTTWYTLDNLFCNWEGCGTDAEYLIRNIIPLCDPNDPPVALCQDVTVSADANCEADASIDNGSYDPDGDPITITQTPSGPYGLGATGVTLTVEDDHGWVSTCAGVVTVVDDTPPDITCPSNVTVECSSHCGTPAADPQLTGFFAGVSATDNCDASVDITDDSPLCFALGTTTVTFTATDDYGNQTTCTADVTVLDTTPPEIEVTLSRYVLWPPNHKMVTISAEVAVSDICDDSPTWVLTSITSSEPEDSLGDGSTEPDIQDAQFGTADDVFKLRSERSGGGIGRLYTIVFTATDGSGNQNTATAVVRVPHNYLGSAFASTGFNQDGTGFDRSLNRFAVVIPSKAGVYGIDETGKTVLVESFFDATQLDMTQVHVGNTRGAFLPEERMELDTDSDGLTDIALFYSILAVEPLIDRIEPTLYGEAWIADPIDPVGIHYVSAGGVDYIVPNIFELGEPVEPGSAAGVADGKRPNVTALYPVIPNPFASSTTIRFSLLTDEHVVLRVYDARGMLVRSIVDRVLPAGVHDVVWNGHDGDDRAVAAGIYFIRFSAGTVAATQKMMLVR